MVKHLDAGEVMMITTIAPTATGGGRFTPESARRHVDCYMVVREGDVDLRQAIADHMVRTDGCTYHSVHVVRMAAYECGLLPSHKCTICGGRRIYEGDHSLCVARTNRGTFDIERHMLDDIDGILCPCTPCRKRTGDFRKPDGSRYEEGE